MTVQESAALAPGQVADLLAAMATTLEAEVRALPEEALGWHPAPGEWCVKEALGHLIEAERRGFAGRIRLLLEQDEPTLESWDQRAIAEARKDCERSGPDVLREMLQLRESSVALARGLTEQALGRGGLHPKVGHLRIGDLLQEWVHHDRNHVRQGRRGVGLSSRAADLLPDA